MTSQKEFQSGFVLIITLLMGGILTLLTTVILNSTLFGIIRQSRFIEKSELFAVATSGLMVAQAKLEHKTIELPIFKQQLTFNSQFERVVAGNSIFLITSTARLGNNKLTLQSEYSVNAYYKGHQIWWGRQ